MACPEIARSVIMVRGEALTFQKSLQNHGGLTVTVDLIEKHLLLRSVQCQLVRPGNSIMMVVDPVLDRRCLIVLYSVLRVDFLADFLESLRL